MTNRLEILASVLVLVVTLTGGCFLGRDPVLTEGEDVGPVLGWKVYFPGPDPYAGVAVEFRRVGRNEYTAYYVSPTKWSGQLFSKDGTALIRRAGDRAGAPIYLVQADMRVPGDTSFNDDSFAEGFVAINADGVGVQAVFDCSNEAVVALAKGYGMELACNATGLPGNFSVMRVPDGKADALGFFAAARAAGLVVWEDEAGVSVLH